VAEGLSAGEYEVTIEAGSVPAGYPVNTLARQRVHVQETVPGRVTFVLTPYRSVSGRARLFNRETGQYVSLVGATVELQPLRRQSVTDANGQYAFRDLPPGEYTIVAKHGGRDHVQAVSVPEGPAVVKDMDVAMLPASNVVIANNSRRGGNPEERPAIAAHTSKDRDERGDVQAATPGGSFTIHVAESTSPRHARAMVTELQDAGHTAYLVEAARSGASVPYYVRVGRYTTFDEATRSARILEKSIGWRLSVAPVAPHVAAAGKAVSGGE
jgi:hypothetical protein